MSRVPVLALLSLFVWVGCTPPSAARPDAGVDGSEGGPQLESSEAVIDAVVAAYGGAGALAKMQTFRIEGTLEAHIRGFSGSLRRDYVAPDKYRVDIGYPSGSEVRILAGQQSWRGDQNRQPAVAGPPRQAMVYQLLRSTLPEALSRFHEFIVLVGHGEFDGRQSYLLRLPSVEGVQVQYWVDAESFHVVRVQGNFSVGPMMLDFATTYSDFRVVEGVAVAFHEENFANYNHTGTTTLQRVVFAPIDPGPFAPSDTGTAATSVGADVRSPPKRP